MRQANVQTRKLHHQLSESRERIVELEVRRRDQGSGGVQAALE